MAAAPVPPFVNNEIILTVAEAVLPDPNPYTPSLSGGHAGTISRITVLTGHITTHIQVACIAVVQDQFDELTDFLKIQGLLREVVGGRYSHIYCPFIWRVLTLGGTVVPPSWLTYGPRSAGLFENIVTTPRNPAGENAIIFPNRYGTDLSDPTVYSDPAWDEACLEASQIPDAVNRIYALVTGTAAEAGILKRRAGMAARSRRTAAQFLRRAAAHFRDAAATAATAAARLAVAPADWPKLAAVAADELAAAEGDEVPENNFHNLGGGARHRYKTRRIKRRKSRLLSRRR